MCIILSLCHISAYMIRIPFPPFLYLSSFKFYLGRGCNSRGQISRDGQWMGSRCMIKYKECFLKRHVEPPPSDSSAETFIHKSFLGGSLFLSWCWIGFNLVLTITSGGMHPRRRQKTDFDTHTHTPKKTLWGFFYLVKRGKGKENKYRDCSGHNAILWKQGMGILQCSSGKILASLIRSQWTNITH